MRLTRKNNGSELRCSVFQGAEVLGSVHNDAARHCRVSDEEIQFRQSAGQCIKLVFFSCQGEVWSYDTSSHSHFCRINNFLLFSVVCTDALMTHEHSHEQTRCAHDSECNACTGGYTFHKADRHRAAYTFAHCVHSCVCVCSLYLSVHASSTLERLTAMRGSSR